MHKRYSVAEAKNQLPAVLHAVELGDPVEITRHGRAVAVVLSFEQYHQLRGSKPDLWPAYQSWLARRAALDDDDVDALADATRATEPGARVDW